MGFIIQHDATKLVVTCSDCGRTAILVDEQVWRCPSCEDTD